MCYASSGPALCCQGSYQGATGVPPYDRPSIGGGGGLEVEWIGKENEVDWIGVEERRGDW